MVKPELYAEALPFPPADRAHPTMYWASAFGWLAIAVLGLLFFVQGISGIVIFHPLFRPIPDFPANIQSATPVLTSS
jgi:hypothetical protein